MGLFENGKEISPNVNLSEIESVLKLALEKVENNLVDRLSKQNIVTRQNQISPCIDNQIDEGDMETMKALAKASSSTVTIQGTNFSKLGKDEDVLPRTNIDDVIGTLGDIE